MAIHTDNLTRDNMTGYKPSNNKQSDIMTGITKGKNLTKT